eukprot:SAG11_NODE_1087_length_5925_cov_2.708376_2_plen_165_part_00
MFSSDGVQWPLAPADTIAAGEILLAGRDGGDTHNNLCRISDATFGVITRLDVRNSSNERRVALSTTVDFMAYSEAKQVLSGAAGNQTYGMQVSPWAGLFIGSLAVYASGESHEKVFNELAISYDGRLRWDYLLYLKIFLICRCFLLFFCKIGQRILRARAVHLP